MLFAGVRTNIQSFTTGGHITHPDEPATGTQLYISPSDYSYLLAAAKHITVTNVFGNCVVLNSTIPSIDVTTDCYAVVRHTY